MKTKKKKPQDSTMRNVRATNRRLDEAERKLRVLFRAFGEILEIIKLESK